MTEVSYSIPYAVVAAGSVNLTRLRAEVETALGQAIIVHVTLPGADAGVIVLRRADGQPLTPAQQAAAQSTCAAHNPAPTAEQQLEAAAHQISEQSLAQAGAIAGWARTSEPDALAWHDANIRAPLDALADGPQKTLLQAMATEQRAILRLVIALRNRTWPHLEAGG